MIEKGEPIGTVTKVKRLKNSLEISVKKSKKQKINGNTGEITTEEENVEVQNPGAKPEILSDMKLPFYGFEIKQLLVKDGQRLVTLVLYNYFSKVYMNYNVILVCNTEPFEDQIQAVIDAKVEYEAQEQVELLPNLRREELKRFDDQERKLRINMAELMAKCPDITFVMKVNKIDDTGENIKLECQINSETLNDLNDHWQDVTNYKIQLQHGAV